MLLLLFAASAAAPYDVAVATACTSCLPSNRMLCRAALAVSMLIQQPSTLFNCARGGLTLAFSRKNYGLSGI